MRGIGVSYCAITVINAIPCGLGATIGINLKTIAEFNITGNEKRVYIKNDPDESTEMAKICVAETYNYLKKSEPSGWILDINSEIPISRGLKSSSSACNAIISSVLNTNNEKVDEMDLILLGVKCAKKSNVTITGSFDDSCGCQLGGIVFANNISNSLISHNDIEDYDVVLHIPEYKIRKTNLPINELKEFSKIMEELLNDAIEEPFSAMIKNGEIISSVLGIDNNISKIAVENGALCAGVTGTGPAIAIILNKGESNKFLKKTGLTNVIITNTRGISH